MTAFYMFRLWYLTFAGNPRDGQVYRPCPRIAEGDERAAADPGGVGGRPGVERAWSASVCEPLLEQARPLGIATGIGRLAPAESGDARPSTLATGAKAKSIGRDERLRGGAGGLRLRHGVLRPAEARVAEDPPAVTPLYRFFVHKWWFDELYALCSSGRCLRLAGWVADIDRNGIDWLADGSARAVAAVARIDNWIDRVFVDRW